MEQSQLTRRGGQLSSENQTSSGCANNDNDGSQARKGESAFAKAAADRLGLGFVFHRSFAISSSFDIRISSFGFSPMVWARGVGRARGVGATLGVGVGLGVGVTVGVAVEVGVAVGVAVGVTVTLGVGVGVEPACAQYFPPVFE